MRAKICFMMVAVLTACENLEGPVGPAGPKGEKGEPGETLAVQVVTGTILNRNYTDGNPDFASIPVANAGEEPTILFLGIENANGVFNRTDYSGVIWGGTGGEFAVPGSSGYYVLVHDPDKDFVSANYQVKFVQ